jgi:hypothetical protein
MWTMRKKGQLGWENIYTWILVLVFLAAILMFVFMNKERTMDYLDKIRLFFRFGGG